MLFPLARMLVLPLLLSPPPYTGQLRLPNHLLPASPGSDQVGACCLLPQSPACLRFQI